MSSMIRLIETNPYGDVVVYFVYDGRSPENYIGKIWKCGNEIWAVWKDTTGFAPYDFPNKEEAINYLKEMKND